MTCFALMTDFYEAARQTLLSDHDDLLCRILEELEDITPDDLRSLAEDIIMCEESAVGAKVCRILRPMLERRQCDIEHWLRVESEAQREWREALRDEMRREE